MHPKVVVFDLDDTLYKEIYYVKSAFSEIAKLVDKVSHIDITKYMWNDYYENKDVFSSVEILSGARLTKQECIKIYRNHIPDISMQRDDYLILHELYRSGTVCGLITDGRSITQRNKIKALKVDRYFIDSNIIISEEFGSEKPNIRNYQTFCERYPLSDFYYVGDNPAKDFISPNKLGWTTICLLDKEYINIHSQNFSMPKEYIPQYKFNSLKEILPLI